MKKFYILYIVICTFYLISIANFPLAKMVFKPLIVSSLLAWYIVRVPKQHNMIILGLIFAIIGDVLLLFDSDSFFKFGLGAFLLMQLCYISYLRQFVQKELSKMQKALIIFVSLLLIIFIYLAFSYQIQEFYIVLIYALALGIMSITALRFPRLKKEVSIIGVGAVLFVISDFVLASNKFFTSILYGDYIVMITYMLAQFLIVKGIADDAAHYFYLKNKGKS